MIRFSVIIPTYNRFDALLETLRTIEAQHYPRSAIQVVVVDDGSTSAGKERIFESAWSFELKYIRQDNRGSAFARNAGAAQAEGEILIFVDDDVLLLPNYVAGLAAEHEQFPHLIGMGRFLPYLPAGASPFGKVNAEITASSQPTGWVDFTQCVTNNLSVTAADFYQIGGMQDVAGDGPTYWGDVDFGYRAFQLGFRFLRSGRADCIHCDYGVLDYQKACQRVKQWGEKVHRLEQKHPGILSYLPMFSDMLPLNWQQDGVRLGLRKLLRRCSATPLVTWLLNVLIQLAERTAAVWALRPLYRWALGACLYRGFQAGVDDARRA